MRQFDHFVYCVSDLDAAIETFIYAYGIEPIIGGRHIQQGTKNALVSLGDSTYLELLAIDKEAAQNIKHHWMGIDYITKPKITRWAISSNQMNDDLKIIGQYNPKLSKRHNGNRVRSDGKVLKWKMSLPSHEPEVELMPFLLDWSKSDHHPTEQLVKQAQIVAFDLYHDSPKDLQSYFENLEIDVKILKAKASRIALTLEGPKGGFTL